MLKYIETIDQKKTEENEYENRCDSSFFSN